MDQSQVFAAREIPVNSYVYTVNWDTVLRKSYRVIKFDGFLNVEHIWIIKELNGGILSCGCWAGKYGNCKHRPIIRTFDMLDRINRGWFYDYEQSRWYLPVKQPQR